MKLKIVSWNVRGAKYRDRRKVLKASLRTQKADLFCLQENKIQSMSSGLVRSLGVGRFLNWGSMDVEGVSSDILVF